MPGSAVCRDGWMSSVSRFELWHGFNMTEWYSRISLLTSQSLSLILQQLVLVNETSLSSKNLRSEVPGALSLLEIKVRSLLSKLIEQTQFQMKYLAYQTRQEDFFLNRVFRSLLFTGKLYRR